jgi:hypothetical protein
MTRRPEPVVDLNRALASYVVRWQAIPEPTRRRILHEQTELRATQ